jgi:amidohydrolase
MGLGRAPEEFQGAGSNYHRRTKGTGLTADIVGGAGPGPCVALRADIDALPIVETNGSAADQAGYKSENDGCMHACGHDAHTAMLLATAAVLVKTKDRLKGTVRLIFQPAEEFGAGAKYMVRDGVMDGVDEVYGVHVMNFLELGKIGVKSGPLMGEISQTALKPDFTINQMARVECSHP